MLKARSDLRGYIPGQVIKLAAEIHNKSGKDTGCVLASLIQVTLRLKATQNVISGRPNGLQCLTLERCVLCFAVSVTPFMFPCLCRSYLTQKVTYKTKRRVFDLRTIAEVEGAGVKAGKHAEWREQIIVPPLPQSALTGCSLIDVDYFIQVGGSAC